ncbi:MAG: hypothetical protein HOV80_22415 [Polyangiaceae bacterium]|nr:hypothetical protein [Polyangiaceae bacterium]
MDLFHRLPDKFARARLDLELRKEPISRARGQDSIVQLDITDATRGPQRFRLFPGARDNRIEVLGPDSGRRQLVLFVDEPRRAFEVWISKKSRVPDGARVVRETATTRAIEQFTPGRKRHFLCGMDEQHLFIAELPYGVSSAHAARESLRAPEVPSSLKLRGERIIRQGEWFFLPLLPRERALAEHLVARRLVQRDIGIAQAARIPRAGRPHVASEVVVSPAEKGGGSVIFVRGEVRHPDHQTIVLREFHRTVPNREKFDRPEGVYWID